MPAPDAEPITIALSPAQVEHVLRRARAGPPAGLASLLASAPPSPEAFDGGDGRLSRSLLRGLVMLSRFAPGAERGIVELSRELGLSASTAHRYAQTLVHLGLLERSPASRRYRLPPR